MFTLQVNDHVKLALLESKQAEAINTIVDKDRDFIGQWLPWARQSTEVSDYQQYIKMMRKNMAAATDYGLAILYDGEVVGGIGLHIRSSIDRRAEIGYWLIKGQNGKGIMTQSAKALADYGFGALRMNRLLIRAASENPGSQNVAKRLGFSHEMTARKGGVITDADQIDQLIDMQYYAMLSEDWRLPASVPEFAYGITEDTELRLLLHHHDAALYNVIHENRSHLRDTQSWVNDIQTAADAHFWIETLLEKYAEDKGYAAGIWHENTLVGGLQVDVDHRGKAAKLAYWSAADTAAEVIVQAVRGVTDYAFTENKLERVEIACLPDETQRYVPEALGFTLEGIRRQTRRIQGHYLDSLIYAMLAEDWTQNGANA